MPYLRSQIELGFTRWIVENRALAYQTGLIALDVAQLTPDGVREALRSHGITVTMDGLMDLAERATQHGVAEQWAEEFKIFHKNRDPKNIIQYRRLRGEALKLEGVMVTNALNAGRPEHGTYPQWKPNTCAVDVVMSIATLIDAGRVRVDQVPPHHWLERHLPAQLLLQYVSYQPISMSRKQHDASRDVILQGLSKLNFSKYGQRPYEFRGVQSMFEDCFDRLPQLSWTRVDLEQICQQPTYRVSRTPIHYCSITLNASDKTPGNTLAEQIQHELSFSLTRSSNVLCDRHNACGGCRQTIFYGLVVDRTPPRFCVHLQGIWHYDVVKQFRCLDPLTVSFRHYNPEHVTGGAPWIEKQRSFYINGIIFFIYGNHYFLRWRVNPAAGDQEKILHIDKGEVSMVDDWWAALEKPGPDTPPEIKNTTACLTSIIYVDTRFQTNSWATTH